MQIGKPALSIGRGLIENISKWYDDPSCYRTEPGFGRGLEAENPSFKTNAS